jgi:hypothetical protein
VIDDSRNPRPAVRGGRQVGEDRRVLYRDLLLVVVTVRDPGLHLSTTKPTGYKAPVEGVLIVVALRA